MQHKSSFMLLVCYQSISYAWYLLYCYKLWSKTCVSNHVVWLVRSRMIWKAFTARMREHTVVCERRYPRWMYECSGGTYIKWRFQTVRKKFSSIIESLCSFGGGGCPTQTFFVIGPIVKNLSQTFLRVADTPNVMSSSNAWDSGMLFTSTAVLVPQHVEWEKPVTSWERVWDNCRWCKAAAQMLKNLKEPSNVGDKVGDGWVNSHGRIHTIGFLAGTNHVAQHVNINRVEQRSVL